MAHAPEKLYLAAPRGYCAGVDRAVQTVERALELYGPPVYVRKEIVHNKHVVEQLAERGAVFVDQETEVPEGETVVFSAHGVAPTVHANAEARGLQTIDATCPLVTKVHVEAKKFAAEGYTIVLIGHEGHEEVEGTMGEAPDHIVLIETEEDVDRLEVDDPTRIAYISQTTLSVDETRAIIARLREKFPEIVGPRTDDICYATTNRQAAVRQMAGECDLVLVIGSKNSSNSNRLVEVARAHGAESHLIDNETQVREEWLEGKRVVGISSGASAPEELVQRLVEFFRAARHDATSPSSRSSRRTSASCSRRRSGRRWRRPGRELHAVQAQSRRLGLDAAVRDLVEPGLDRARQDGPGGAARVLEDSARAGVLGLDVVLAVVPVPDELEPVALARQHDVRGLRLEHHARARPRAGSDRAAPGRSSSSSISSRSSWIACSHSR